MDVFTRQPPRFVPTLTDVVPEAAATQPEAAASPQPARVSPLQDWPFERQPAESQATPPSLSEAAAESALEAALTVTDAEPDTDAVITSASAPAPQAAPAAEPLLLSPDELPTLHLVYEPEAVESQASALLLPEEGAASLAEDEAALAISLDIPMHEPAFAPPQVGHSQADAPSLSVDAMQAVHDALVQRVLDRVQPLLEAQLREVVADVVYAHAEAMARSLQGAVEEVVQHAVADALAQEHIQTQLGLNSIS